MKKKELNVSAIKDGTVIDHIPPRSLFKVITILKLDKCTEMITFGSNLESGKLKRKAIIKIENIFFEDKEINKIALIAPHAKLNIIKDYEVVDKKVVEIPNNIKSIVRCFNPKCITNHECIPTKFKVIEKSPLALKCHYCETITTEDQMEII